MGALLSRVTAPGTLAQVRHVTPVRPGAARGLVAGVYAQVERDFGMLAPPVIMHSPAPETMAACWLLLRESLLASGTVSRVLKEVVATEVSAANTCPYCVDVHRATLRGISRREDPGIRRVASWARASALRQTAERHEPPLLVGHSQELLAVAVTFHYLNRMVNVFLGDSPLPPELPRGARGAALRLFGLVMRPAARRSRRKGDSLTLLPAAPVPADLAWTRGARHVEGAFARAVAAVEAGGARRLPEPVRDLITTRVAAWEGHPPGLGRGWADEAVTGLPEAQRPAARLALLTALASYQVDAGVVAGFRRGDPDPEALIEVTAWAALAAARRVAAWQPLRRDPINTAPNERTVP
ncbi:carboxymuconolactone decarboxylase family protein [Nonomuraea sp. SBT364]|uniref:carboxymuconolactone decarboxylase family protein n=1 Tax=Nonomuraea sp. SBT364 TaxID=1580530 RepID=UPI00066DA66A|nr:carboxymuconolactone decarboxylase family protein [Nonomuraea sp. SBT364]